MELGASYWLLSGSLAEDLTTTLPADEVYASTDSIRDAASDALAAISEYGHIPVLVADDTDRLLRMPGTEMSRRLFEGFFGEVLRMIVETLEAALVVAVHDGYREDGRGYDELVEGRIEHHLAVPEISRPEQLGQLVTGRAQFIEPAATWRDLLTAAALDELLTLHVGAHRRSLRKTLADQKSAFALAIADQADLVNAQHVRAAAAG